MFDGLFKDLRKYGIRPPLHAEDSIKEKNHYSHVTMRILDHYKHANVFRGFKLQEDDYEWLSNEYPETFERYYAPFYRRMDDHVLAVASPGIPAVCCVCQIPDEFPDPDNPTKLWTQYSEFKFYEANHIIDELDQTYQKLKIERDNLTKAHDVHQKLMKEILRESELKSIANTLFQHIGKPVLIEDSNFHLLSLGGMSHKEAQAYSEQLKNYPHRIGKTALVEVSSEHRRAITPTYRRQKVIGYFSFLYKEPTLKEIDSLILEHASMACSLYLLNERTRVQAEQRMRGSLLEDILSKRISHE